MTTFLKSSVSNLICSVPRPCGSGKICSLSFSNSSSVFQVHRKFSQCAPPMKVASLSVTRSPCGALIFLSLSSNVFSLLPSSRILGLGSFLACCHYGCHTKTTESMNRKAWLISWNRRGKTPSSGWTMAMCILISQAAAIQLRFMSPQNVLMRLK